MNITIIVIGDELLLGQVTDTNSGEIARAIDPHGWQIDKVLTVSDTPAAIKWAVDLAMATSQIVITTGGLGPTRDDLTKRTLCDIFGGEMVLDQATLQNVKEVVDRRGIALNELTAAQAIVPSSCTVIQNRVGTAPIMWWERDSKVLVALPGVPFEMREMFHSEVLPRLLNRYPSNRVRRHRCLMVAGITESAAAEKLAPIEDSFPSTIHLAYLPKPGLLRLRLDGDAPAHQSQLLTEQIDSACQAICDKLGNHVLAHGDFSVGELIGHVLSGKGITIATAESCTGGNIAHTITAVPGSSEYFRGSVVAYANEVKTRLLGVDPSLIAEHGVVSEPVAAAMAQGARQALEADFAIATSGIAGPGGATPGKPVGTVCMAIAAHDGTMAWTRHYPGSRDRVIDRTTTDTLVALAFLVKNS